MLYKNSCITSFQTKTKTYVPPSNIINTTGLSALNDAVPTMETVASLYVGSKSNGSLIQEFGPDEHNKNIYHFRVLRVATLSQMKNNLF